MSCTRTCTSFPITKRPDTGHAAFHCATLWRGRFRVQKTTCGSETFMSPKKHFSCDPTVTQNGSFCGTRLFVTSWLPRTVECLCSNEITAYHLRPRPWMRWPILVAEWLWLDERAIFQSASKNISSLQLEEGLERKVWDSLEDDKCALLKRRIGTVPLRDTAIRSIEHGLPHHKNTAFLCYLGLSWATDVSTSCGHKPIFTFKRVSVSSAL